MNNLNYLCDIVRMSNEHGKSGIDTLELVEKQVTKYMAREDYQGSYLTPHKRFYEQAIKVVERYYNMKGGLI